MLIRLEAPLRQALRLVVEAADPLPVALVGGAVRDLLLHRVHKDPWCGLPDLDLVVEQPPEASGPPAAHRIARLLAERLGPRLRRCQLHEAFGTVELEIEGVLLDLATARREWYAEPGANPTVRYGSLRDDLARRDLSINAIAVLLEGRQLAESSATDNLESPVLDPYGGQVDLAARRLRFLHADSLRDDPTRIVRAARYGARLAMDLAPDALNQWHATLNAWPWRLAAEGTPDSTGETGPAMVVPPSLGTRLRKELEVLLGREPWQRGLELLQQWRGLELLDPALQADHGWRWRLRTSQRLLRLAALPPWPPEQWLLLALVAPLPDPLALAERLQLPHRSQVPLRGLMRLRGWLAAHQPPPAQRPALTPAQLSQALERQGLTPEAVILALVSLPSEPWRRGLLRWLLRWRSLPSPTSARALMDQGHPAGPALGERLRQLRAERLERERW